MMDLENVRKVIELLEESNLTAAGALGTDLVDTITDRILARKALTLVV